MQNDLCNDEYGERLVKNKMSGMIYVTSDLHFGQVMIKALFMNQEAFRILLTMMKKLLKDGMSWCSQKMKCISQAT